MVIVIKYFTDSKDGFKPYKVGDKHDFGKERNDYLVDSGYAEFIKRTKVLEPTTKKKPLKLK